MQEKKKYKIPGEIVKIETVETLQGGIKNPVSIEKTKESGEKVAKKIIKKNDGIRQEKAFRKIAEANEKKKKLKNINTIQEIKDVTAKKVQKSQLKKYCKSTRT